MESSDKLPFEERGSRSSSCRTGIFLEMTPLLRDVAEVVSNCPKMLKIARVIEKDESTDLIWWSEVSRMLKEKESCIRFEVVRKIVLHSQDCSNCLSKWKAGVDSTGRPLIHRLVQGSRLVFDANQKSKHHAVQSLEAKRRLDCLKRFNDELAYAQISKDHFTRGDLLGAVQSRYEKKGSRPSERFSSLLYALTSETPNVPLERREAVRDAAKKVSENSLLAQNSSDRTPWKEVMRPFNVLTGSASMFVVGYVVIKWYTKDAGLGAIVGGILGLVTLLAEGILLVLHGMYKDGSFDRYKIADRRRMHRKHAHVARTGPQGRKAGFAQKKPAEQSKKTQ